MLRPDDTPRPAIGSLAVGARHAYAGAWDIDESIDPSNERTAGPSVWRAEARYDRRKTVATIVLADDSDDLRSVFAAGLRLHGHEVIEAADGLEAIAQVRAHQPDLLLLDVWMPNASGLEVLDALRSEPVAAQLKVAMLSVLGDAETQLAAFGSGAIAYVVKGIGLAEFVRRVEELLVAPIPAGPAPRPA
jgi:CheY-like chemotaxis protein